MKKIVALLFASLIMLQSFAAVNVEFPARKASEVFFPLGNTGKMVSLLELTTMRAKDFQSLTGQHLKFSERVGFKLSQNQLKTLINPDGTVNGKKLDLLTKRMKKFDTSDQKKNLRLALIFAGVGIGLYIIAGITGGAAGVFWTLGSLALVVAVVFFVIWLVNMA